MDVARKRRFDSPRPGQERDWIFVTGRGREFRKVGDPQRFKAAKFLPHETLDPQLAAKAGPPFLRGDYDSAVFEAFKQVEICVRTLSGRTSNELGVQLMRMPLSLRRENSLTQISHQENNKAFQIFLLAQSVHSRTLAATEMWTFRT